MKKLIIAAIAAGSLIGMQAMATVTLEITAENLYDSLGNPLNGNSEVLMVIDTGTGLPSGNINQFSLFGADNVGGYIQLSKGVAVIMNTGNNTSGPGTIDLFDSTIVLGTDGITTGDKVGLLWLPDTLDGAATTAAGWYGDIENTGFTVPSDGSGVSYDYSDTLNGGADSVASHGAVAGMVIPEPSSIALVVMGLLGGIGLIRRRS